MVRSAILSCCWPAPCWLCDPLLKLGVQVVRSVRRLVLRLRRATPDIAAWRQIAFALGARAGWPLGERRIADWRGDCYRWCRRRGLAVCETWRPEWWDDFVQRIVHR